MNIALWVIAGLVALAMLVTGASKLIRPRDQLIASGNFDWAEDFTQSQIRAIGIAEILGGVGLILPGALGVAVWLTPLAAAGVALVMIRAAAIHVRRGEHRLVAPPIVLAVLAGLVAALRFGPLAF